MGSRLQGQRRLASNGSMGGACPSRAPPTPSVEGSRAPPPPLLGGWYRDGRNWVHMDVNVVITDGIGGGLRGSGTMPAADIMVVHFDHLPHRDVQGHIQPNGDIKWANGKEWLKYNGEWQSPGPASESSSRDPASEALIVAASCPSEGQPSSRTCTTDENIDSRSCVAWHRLANKLILREKADYETLWSNVRRNSRTAITHLQSGGTLTEYRVMMMQRSACQKTREAAEGMMTRKDASSTACDPSAPPSSSSAAPLGSPESPGIASESPGPASESLIVPAPTEGTRSTSETGDGPLLCFAQRDAQYVSSAHSPTSPPQTLTTDDNNTDNQTRPTTSGVPLDLPRAESHKKYDTTPWEGHSLHLDLDQAQALAAMGLPDDGSNRSESFLDARRGAMWDQMQSSSTPSSLSRSLPMT